LVAINYTYYLIYDSQSLKIDKEILDRVDKYGHKIDFVFCFKCYHFIDISEYKEGDEVKCRYCNTDKFIK